MTREALFRWVLIFAFVNIGLTSYLLFVRPDVAAGREAEHLYEQASALDDAGNFEAAEKIYAAILDDYAVAPIAPRVGYALAQLYMRKTFQMDAAREVLERVAADYPDSEWGARAAEDAAFFERHWDHDGEPLRMWFRASEANKRGEFARAAEILEDLLSTYPDAKVEPKARFHLDRLRARIGQVK